ncbi:MAG: hypothetical protein WD077_15900 [Bacteroidia bacterium]
MNNFANSGKRTGANLDSSGTNEKSACYNSEGNVRQSQMRMVAVFLLGVVAATFFLSGTWEDEKRKGIVAAVAQSDLRPETSADYHIYRMSYIANNAGDQQYAWDQHPESKEYKNHYKRVDSLYKDLMAEITANGADEQIIDELILNYKIKIKILEALKKQLEIQGGSQEQKPEASKGV